MGCKVWDLNSSKGNRSMSSKTSKLIVAPTQPPIQGVQGALSRGTTNQGMRLSIHHHSVPRSRLTGAKPPVPYTGWCTKCHTIDCARNTFLLLQKHLTSGTVLILIGWKIVPNEEHVQCDHCFASQPLANEPLHSSQRFDTSLQKVRSTTSLCGP